MNKAIKQQIQAKFDKYHLIKSQIMRYSNPYPIGVESKDGIDKVLQFERYIFGDYINCVYAPSRIRELACYCKIIEPLVICHKTIDDHPILAELKQKNDTLFFLASSRYQVRIYNFFDESAYSKEDVCSPFIESQKILENALLYSEIICAASMMMLAFIEQKEVLSCHQKILNSNTLEEIERYQEEHSDFQEITPDMLRNITEVLLKKRSLATFLADFIQEIIDDLSDLLSISNHLVIFQRSTASLAQGLFREVSYTKASPSNSFKLI